MAGELIKQKYQADTRHLCPTWGDLTEDFASTHGGSSAIETHIGNGYIYEGRDVEDETLRNQWRDHHDGTADPAYVKNKSPERI